MEKTGITVAGNIILDIVKSIDCFPKLGMLANIQHISRSIGGCAPNTAIDLAKFDSTLPIEVIGRVGNDEYADFALSTLHQYGIKTNQVRVSTNEPTSFTDVMNLEGGERTFFHARGANAEFSPEQINLDELNCKMLHIGYILLLDTFDQEDKEYGTVMAGFLSEVQKRGIKTSIDVVSDSNADYQKKIVPALKYCDNVIINEIECCSIIGIDPYDSNGKIKLDAIKEAMHYVANQGVKEKVIVHCKTIGLCYDVPSQKFTLVPSLKIPKEKMKGSVGAGDAFCAGCLYGIYHGWSDQEILEFASSAAATNLFAANSIDGILSKDEILALPNEYERLPG